MKTTAIRYLVGMSTEEFSLLIRNGLRASPLVLTTGVDSLQDQRPFWDEVSERCGTGCFSFAEDWRTGAKTGDKWNEIRYDPAIKDAYRYSNNAQPLHTDGAYMKKSPEVVFFYCINRAPSGGETTFLSPEILIEVLQRTDPGLLGDLRSTPVHFSKAEEHRVQSILSEDETGVLLNWNYYTVDKSVSSFISKMTERFHAFLQTQVVPKGLTHPVGLCPGDAVFFHDARLLHGRNAFDARKKDDRFLLKSAFDLPVATRDS